MCDGQCGQLCSSSAAAASAFPGATSAIATAADVPTAAASTSAGRPGSASASAVAKPTTAELDAEASTCAPTVALRAWRLALSERHVCRTAARIFRRPCFSGSADSAFCSGRCFGWHAQHVAHARATATVHRGHCHYFLRRTSLSEMEHRQALGPSQSSGDRHGR